MAGGDIDFRSDSDAYMIDNDHINIITDAFESENNVFLFSDIRY